MLEQNCVHSNSDIGLLSMIEKLSSDITSLLQEAVNESLENYEVIIEGGNDAGSGYLGEMVFTTVRNKLNNQLFNFVIKQAIPANAQSTKEIMKNVFFNEIYFYQNVVREYEKFQKAFPKAKPFEKVPKSFAFRTDEGKQSILMENLKMAGFTTIPRKAAFDDTHTKLLLEAYGHFHGLSAAFRERNPEKFNKFRSLIANSIEPMNDIMEKTTNDTFSQLIQIVEDEKIKERLDNFKEKGYELAMDSLKYDGKNPVINHGDCWSNNIMFKYDENGKVADLRLVDFQLSRVGSVVSDLSYLLYSGVEKKILDNLDDYLKIYHSSFSNTLRSFDLDPLKIFTFEDLKNEFKKHYMFGFVFSMLAWPNKLSDSFITGNVVEISEATGIPDSFYTEAFKNNDIKEACLNVVNHLYSSNLL